MNKNISKLSSNVMLEDFPEFLLNESSKAEIHKYLRILKEKVKEETAQHYREHLETADTFLHNV